MAHTRITISTHGPYKLEGGCSVLKKDGTLLGTADEPLWLCRCGQSGNKPFCDGSHKTADFDGTLAV